MMVIIRKILIFCTIAAISGGVYAQRKVTFTTPDGLIVTADLYRLDKSAPYIILLHRENSSRGEYRDIAPKLQKIGFNCLAVDLRYGKESNFVRNETVAQAQQKGVPATMQDCEKDIRAAIDYIIKISVTKRCILMGSAFSASLAMKVANRHPQVMAVAAFSPGEYFDNPNEVKNGLTDFDRMLWVATTRHENPFVADMLQHIPEDLLTLFQPASGNGLQGAPALWDEDAESNEYWMSLMLFLNKVKETHFL